MLIESEANSLLKQISDTVLDLSGYKENRDGSISERISAYIMRGNDRIPFESMSEGEKARVEITAIIAIQKILNSCSNGKGLDFLIIDEVLESVDQAGVRIIVDSLRCFRHTIYLINHSGANNVYEDEIIVNKTDKVSVVL